MENKLDQLFRNKLSDHKVNPSEASWEKLSSHLNKARWRRTQSRLAIAATFIVIMTVIGVAYHYLDDQKNDLNPVISENAVHLLGDHKKTNPTQNNQQTIISQNETTQTIESKQEINEMQPAVITRPEVAEIKSKEHEQEQSVTPHQLEIKETQELPVLAETVAEAQEEAINPDPKDSESEVLAQVQSTSEPLTVTITYRANKNSKLVESQKNNILNAGLDKIAGFAEERILTDELKTKLRNTKEDVLALNFGKLINKQNKEY